MRAHTRIPIAVPLVLLACACSAPAAQAGFGVQPQNFEAGTCTTSSCVYSTVVAKHEAFTQAAGHPPDGITSFEFNSTGSSPFAEPEGRVKRIRVDLPPGLAADPEAVERCPVATFEASKCASEYPNSRVGTDDLTVDLLGDDTVEAPVYDLQQPAGLALDFGIEVSVLVIDEHIFLEGHVSWSTDYHEYFEINNVSESIPLLKSKLIFNGTAGTGNFLTLPSECSSTTTSRLEVESHEGQISRTETHTPLGVEGCGNVPFAPTATVAAGAGQSASDAPDGATVTVSVPQHATSTNSADARDVTVTLPEGLTLDPSAARGLAACSEAQIAIGTSSPVSCPAASKIGTVAIETDLPAGSLAGNVYLGSPSGAPITGPPYEIYLDAESPYGVSVRLRGTVTPDPATGRLTATFTGNPQLPFSSLALTFDEGALAPLANPLSCRAGAVDGDFTPYTGGAAALSSSPFAAGGCASPLPFSVSQSTSESSTAAGAYTSYSYTLARPEGRQYLRHVSVTLPAGLLGAIPSVTLCSEAQAIAQACLASSDIGTASAVAGSGPEPFDFTGGTVHLTGPYEGAPYGLLIEVPAVAGPFDLGSVPVRVALNIDPTTSRVTLSADLPEIWKGIPLRLRSVNVTVNRSDFLFNPTNCSPLATEASIEGFVPGSGETAGDSASSSLQVSGCAGLAFRPTFSASSSAKTSKADGASLQTTITQGTHEANIRLVSVTLPAQLVSRLTTLQKACAQATFAFDPLDCPAESKVGRATVLTPVLPGRLTGPAYLVSHGGAAFPDLDLVLEGDGVRVILTGSTQIKGGVTTTTFSTLPDVPVSSVAVELPIGPHSALAANGSFCASPLEMPTTIIGQNGARLSQTTRLTVAGCGVKLLRVRVRGDELLLSVRTTVPGRLSARGAGLHTTYRRLGAAHSAAVLVVPLTRAARGARRPLRLDVRVGFLPRRPGLATSKAFATVTLR
jgi:hypothetical protein